MSLTTTIAIVPPRVQRYRVAFQTNGQTLDERRVVAENRTHALQRALALATAAMAMQNRALAFENVTVTADPGSFNEG